MFLVEVGVVVMVVMEWKWVGYLGVEWGAMKGRGLRVRRDWESK
jgi:hypothetical protein